MRDKKLLVNSLICKKQAYSLIDKSALLFVFLLAGLLITGLLLVYCNQSI